MYYLTSNRLKTICKTSEFFLGEESAIIARNWGLFYVQNQDYEQGRKWLEKALDLDDQDDENYLAIGDFI